MSTYAQTIRPYIAFYGSKKIEVYAASSYAAQQEAAKQLKVPEKKRYQITVKLADITHVADQ